MNNYKIRKTPYPAIGLYTFAFILTLFAMGLMLSSCKLTPTGSLIDTDSLSGAAELITEVSQSSIEAYSSHFNTPRCMYLNAENVIQAKDYIIQELKNDGYDENSISEDDVVITGMTIATADSEYSGVAVEGPFSMPNIIVSKVGSSPDLKPVLIGAHYDTVANGPGANDNGSGCSALLEIARLIAGTSFPRTVVMVFFAFEEPGLIGSQQYVSKLSPEEMPSAVYILDTIGITTEKELAIPFIPLPDTGDFVAAISSSSDKARSEVADFMNISADTTINLPIYGINADSNAASSFITSTLMRSDHLPFLVKGIPAVLITDTASLRDGIEYYHLTTDTVNNLNYVFLTKVTAAVLACVYVKACVNAPDM